MKKTSVSLGTMVGALLVALAISACSAHGGNGGVTCVETMPGMTMCPASSLQVAPSVHASH
jgi:hypothetical protein